VLSDDESKHAALSDFCLGVVEVQESNDWLIIPVETDQSKLKTRIRVKLIRVQPRSSSLPLFSASFLPRFASLVPSLLLL
jgi:hypothetical protein